MHAFLHVFSPTSPFRRRENPVSSFQAARAPGRLPQTGRSARTTSFPRRVSTPGFAVEQTIKPRMIPKSGVPVSGTEVSGTDVSGTDRARNEREAERRKTHPSNGRELSDRGCAPLRGALAFRRSTAACVAATKRRASYPGRASRTWHDRQTACAGEPHCLMRLSKAPCAPVVMPEGSIPGPPGNGVTSPARRNRIRPAIGCVSRSRP